MTANLLTELEELLERIGALETRMRGLEARNAGLEAENEQLRRQASEAMAERDRAKLDCEYLAVSHRLADSPDTIVEARRHLAGMIRNIDRCLEMLKE